ncbi:MAG: protein TolR [Desulfuromonas sp.]|uniref:protein TolR n=1 Tax=Desulfuromonas sp. TaxID=892 RepID=UPI000CB929BB|nr:protein TolR [Desulfuromonas sp.]PLX84043.1 MAG: protein TolR [Desulfuromonas sp.]
MEVGRRESGGRRALSQINVTPFVDVMLVLLIIFMVTAPMLEQGLEVSLPEVEQAPSLEKGKEPVTVSVQKDGAIAVGGHRVSDLKKLAPVLRQVLKERNEQGVLLEADRAVPYGKVVQVMAVIRQAGVQKVGMLTQQPEP